MRIIKNTKDTMKYNKVLVTGGTGLVGKTLQKIKPE